jgi:hypothetical protein
MATGTAEFDTSGFSSMTARSTEFDRLSLSVSSMATSAAEFDASGLGISNLDGIGLDCCLPL